MSAPKHAAKRKQSRGGGPVLVALAAVAVVGGGAAAFVGLHGLPRSSARHGSVPAATSHHPAASGASSGHQAPPPPPPLQLESTSPAAGAEGVAYAPTVTVQLSAPLAAGSPLPVLSPAIPGNWTAEPAGTLVFHPEADYSPYTTVQLTIPGGVGGLRDDRGATLVATVSRSFTVAAGSELRLQQLLAELGYLPVTFVRSSPAGTTTTAATTGPDSAGTGGAAGAGSSKSGSSKSGSSKSGSSKSGASKSGASKSGADSGSAAAGGSSAGSAGSLASAAQPAIDAEATAPQRVELAPEPGTFAWRWQDTPSYLTSLWSPGSDNVVTRGAVMAFEAQSGLAVDGEAGPSVWHALLTAVAARRLDPAPYDWIGVSEAAPETLTVWQDGETLFDVSANTGISEAPTAPGTFPVYARYLVTTMSGKNPNGTTYKDPGIPHVAYFNGGDAIHGFIRAGYGYPQSLGCVELTYADAARVWPYDQLGTLVTVH